MLELTSGTRGGEEGKQKSIHAVCHGLDQQLTFFTVRHGGDIITFSAKNVFRELA